jgi:hypothetical protein
MILDAICFALSGYFMKTSDEFIDEKNNLPLAVITVILCAVFTIIVSSYNGDAACIFISILIGTALAFKVDHLNHILAAIIFLIILYIIGIPHFSWLCLILCTIAAYLDEKGNDLIDEKEEKLGYLNLFDKLLKYRYIMKIMVFILSFLTLVKIMVPNTFLDGFLFFEPITIIYFYFFDLSYEFSEELTYRFNDFFQSFLGRF